MDGSHLEEGLTLKDLFLQIVLPKLDRIEGHIEKKADQGDLIALEARMTVEQRDQKRDIDTLKSWRNRLAGAIAVLSAIAVPAAIEVAVKLFS